MKPKCSQVENYFRNNIIQRPILYDKIDYWKRRIKHVYLYSCFAVEKCYMQDKPSALLLQVRIGVNILYILKINGNCWKFQHLT